MRSHFRSFFPTPSAGPNPNPAPDRTSGKREEVHFYPGEKLLLYLVDDKVVLRAEAWGGPSKRQPRQKGERVAAVPTSPGTFIIGADPTWRNTRNRRASGDR